MKRLLPLLLALSITAVGCSSMLEREYATSSRHVEYPVNEDTSILQAESYQGLVSALLYFVTEHTDTGVVHLSNYLGDVEADLDEACAEVLEQDPLGAYALRGIDHQHTRIVSYYEVTFTFDYAHTREQMERIIPVGNAHSIPEVLSSALGSFEKSCVLRLTYFTGSEADLLAQARQVWLDTPLSALAYPEFRVKLYPDSGSNRVVEYSFSWPEDTEDLAARKAELEAAATRVLQELTSSQDGLSINTLPVALHQRVELDSEGGDTAYDALVSGRCAPRGMTLALQLLCQLAGVESTVVEGRLGGEARFWLILSTDQGYRHLDPLAEEVTFATDEEFSALGFEWSAERYPACTDYGAETAAPAAVSEEFEIFSKKFEI